MFGRWIAKEKLFQVCSPQLHGIARTPWTVHCFQNL